MAQAKQAVLITKLIIKKLPRGKIWFQNSEKKDVCQMKGLKPRPMLFKWSGFGRVHPHQDLIHSFYTSPIQPTG